MNTRKKVEQLEKELAELKAKLDDEFEEGEWIKHKRLVGFLLRYNGDPLSGQYGFDGANEWGSKIESIGVPIKDYRKATPEEIGPALRNEWARRCKEAGWDDPDTAEIEAHAKKGIWYFSLNSGEFQIVYDSGEDFYCNKNGCVYHKGKWASPKPNKIEVNGYEAEFCEGYVKFGCAEISNKLFTDIRQIMHSEYRYNRDISAVKIGEGLFDRETINQICERLK